MRTRRISRVLCLLTSVILIGAQGVPAAATTLDPIATLTSLSDAHLWVGLKNSDDQGTQFDVKVEQLRNGTPIASGLKRCATGVTRNPASAKEVIVSWDAFSPVSLNPGDVLAIRISTRVGTKPDGSKCSGPGGSHTSALGLRLYHDAANRASHFDAAMDTAPSVDFYLHSDGGLCDVPPATAVTTRFLDRTTPTATLPRCADSTRINFAGGNPFAVIGTWSLPPLPEPPSGVVSWSTPSITVTVQRGSSHLESLTVTPNEDVTNGSVAVDPAIRGIVTPAALPSFSLISGEVYDAPLIFDVPLATTVGSHAGNVSIMSATGEVLGSVAVTVHVVDPPLGVVPQDVLTPSGDRIGLDSVGNTLIVDELVVGLEFGTSNPDETILSIAGAHGAVVLGSVPDALTYQLWFPNAADQGQVESIRQSLLGEASVAFASTSFLATSLAAIPNDPLWNFWDEANPGGNNWNLEMIKAPSAWDITTGDRSVPVAVIDADIETDHEDLAANVDAHVGVQIPAPEMPRHGTHVAGIACAVGNNGVGVTGVAWQCSLRAYEKGFAVAHVRDVPTPFAFYDQPVYDLHRMVEATEAGARVVNMSFGNGFGVCHEPPLNDPQAQAHVDLTNDIYARGVLFAEQIRQDVLWVAAAGNRNCDARLVSPASLTTRFPETVITVASVNRDGEKSSFSNFGDVVSVAAPGGERAFLNDQFVFSTFHDTCALWFLLCSPYGDDRGTSMATPHVTGLAALVLSEHDFSAAQTKACIVAGAESDGIAVVGQSFHVINAPAAVKCEDTIALPPKVDLVFSLDLTGSMGDEISQIQLQVGQIMAGLRAAAPDTDFRFGVVSYEDYAGFFDSSVCLDSDYFATYGAAPDAPFRVNLAVTGDQSTVSTVVAGLHLGFGGDGPQSYGRAYWEMGQADTMAQLGLRSDALKLIVDFGDDVPHDADLNKGIEFPFVPPFPSPFDTGYDPGRNGVIECGGDDIDFQDDAIPALASADVHLLHVDSSGDPDLGVYWNLWTSQTGGEFAAINPDGTVPAGLDLTELVIQLLQLIT